MVSGVLVLDKPAGVTSFRMVQHVQRRLGLRRVGHAGTLDPIATGVLPLCVGNATKIVQFLMAGRKVYQGSLRLGATTDTYDAAGQVVIEQTVPELDRATLEAAARRFTGPLLQTPPSFSAVKHQGHRLYKLARQGILVEKEPRQIEVFDFAILHVELPLVDFRIHCNKGTYVRSLVHDLGQYLGCGAHLCSLRRLKNGPFRIEQALTLEDLDKALMCGRLADVLGPQEAALTHIPGIEIDSHTAREIRLGRPVSMARIYDLAQRQEVGPAQGLPYLRLMVRRPNDGSPHAELTDLRSANGLRHTTELVSIVAWTDSSGLAMAERARTLRVWPEGFAQPHTNV